MNEVKYHLIVTPVRLWLFDNNDWDAALTVMCGWCGTRMVVKQDILDVIEEHYRAHQVGPDDSPIEKLDDSCWEDPRLLQPCTNCGGPLKFNPFKVDNKGRKGYE